MGLATYLPGFNIRCKRATGKVVRYLKPERTENTIVSKTPEIRNLPGTSLFILQNKVNETIRKKSTVKLGVWLESMHLLKLQDTGKFIL